VNSRFTGDLCVILSVKKYDTCFFYWLHFEFMMMSQVKDILEFIYMWSHNLSFVLLLDFKEICKLRYLMLDH
jgi:hypothetical protein